MAMMAKMRSLAPAFIVGVGLLFVLFMVLSDSNVMEVFGARTNNVGSVNGEDITYKQFMRAEDQERQQENNNKQKDLADENPEQFRQQVWNALVTQTLLKQQIDKFGISVSDQEIKDIILGPNPPEFLKKSFIDSTGKFNRQLYLNAIYNTRNSQALLQAEEVIRQNRLNQKLQSMLLASITVSEAQIKQKFIDDNTKINAQYALVGLNEFPDSTISVTDDELQSYYNNNLDKYAIKAQRKLKYILFANTPSAEDSSTVERNMETVLNEMKKDTTSFKTLVGIYSSKPYSRDTLSISSLPENAAEKLLTAKPKTVVGPIETRDGITLYNYLGTVRTKNTVVRASHILINQFGSDAKNKAEAMKIYKELKGGANFAQLAEKYSKDPGSAKKGGDLGWFGKGRMVPAFEKACFNGRVGEVQKPIKTSYGYHIIKVTGKTDKKFIIEKIVSPIKASPATRENHLNEAKDFNYISNKDGFEKEAKLMGYTVKQTGFFTKDAYYIPGIGVSQDLKDFAFDNDINDISDVYKVQSGYVVAMISGVIDAGVKPFKDVKNSVKPEVLKEKKFEKSKNLAEQIKSKIGDDLDKAKQVDPKVTTNVTGQFKPQGSIPNVGIDYAFSRKALEIPLNKVSNPVKGERGYYLIKVLARTPFDSSAYSIQKNTIRAQLLQQKKSQFFGQWISNLRKNADIVDNRRQFFGL